MGAELEEGRRWCWVCFFIVWVVLVAFGVLAYVSETHRLVFGGDILG
jgi:hypothetical protein